MDDKHPGSGKCLAPSPTPPQSYVTLSIAPCTCWALSEVKSVQSICTNVRTRTDSMHRPAEAAPNWIDLSKNVHSDSRHPLILGAFRDLTGWTLDSGRGTPTLGPSGL